MATNLKRFYRGTGSNFTETNTILINNIAICNTNASQQTYSITINGVALTSSAVIQGNDTVILDIKQVVPPSEQVSFTSSGNTCIFHFSGVEITS
jgi:hypothetical protein